MTHPQAIKEPGLYLYFEDGSHLALTREVIEAKAKQVMADPKMIPATARAAPAFRPCSICPKRKSADECHALGPAYAFLAELDQYISHDRVTAVYRSADSGHVSEAETSMQRALQYIAIICLMEHCEIGLKYAGYFKGVDPLMDPQQIAGQVYTNIARELGDDDQAVERLIHSMQGEIYHTTRCQVDRLRLVSRSDSVINAFINALTVTDFLGQLQSDHCRETAASGAGP